MRNPSNGDVIAVSVGTLVFFMFTWNYLLPSFLKSLGAGDQLVGLSFSLNFLSYTLFQLIGGAISDRIGRKPLIVLPGYIAAVVYGFLAFCHNVYLGVFLLALAAVMSAFQWPAMLALVSDSTNSPGRYFARMESFITLGIATGPFVGAVLLPYIGVRGLVGLYGLANLIVSILRQVLIKEVRESKQTELRLWASPFSDRKHMMFAISAILTMVAFNFTIYGPFIQLIEKEVLGYSDAQINMSFFYGNIASAAIGLFVGETIEKGKLVLSWAMGLFLLEALLLIWSVNPVLYLLILALPFSQIVHIAYNIGLSRLGDSGNRGRVFGFVNTISGLISAPAPSIGVIMSKNFGIFAPFAVAYGVSIINAAVMGRGER